MSTLMRMIIRLMMIPMKIVVLAADEDFFIYIIK